MPLDDHNTLEYSTSCVITSTIQDKREYLENETLYLAC